MTVATDGAIAFSRACGFHHKQEIVLQAALSRPNPVILAGGSGMGGKSYMLRAVAVYIALVMSSIGVTDPVLYASASYETLRDRAYSKFGREWGHLGTFRSSHGEYGRAFVFDDSKVPPIVFRNLAKPDERRGTEFCAGLLDELTEIPQDIFGAFCYMCRSPQTGWHPIVTTSNPDGIGHGWVKSMFRALDVPFGWNTDPERTLEQITNMPERTAPFSHEEDPSGELDARDYIYIPFLPDDNPKFNEKTFLRGVAHLPAHVQRARRYGMWDFPEGARWPQGTNHMLFETRDKFRAGIPSDYPRILHVDYGLAAPYCALWTAIDPDGDAWTYRCDYAAGFTADRQIERIKALTLPNEQITDFRLDPAMWAAFPRHLKDQVQGYRDRSAADIYAESVADDPRFPAPEPGFNKSRLLAFATLDSLMNRGNGFHDWWIEASACKPLLREIANAVFAKDSKGQVGEDIAKQCADHAITAAYYGLHTWYSPAVDYEEQKRAEEAPPPTPEVKEPRLPRPDFFVNDAPVMGDMMVMT